MNCRWVIIAILCLAPVVAFATTYKVESIYPEDAVKKCIEGWAMVEFSMPESGETINHKVIDSNPKGVFALLISFFTSLSEMSFISAAAVSTIAAYLHWARFRVPITIAVGTAAGVGLLISLTISIFPDAENWLLTIFFPCGILTFVFAMYWDTSDTNRTTRRSDVAFWLHFLSAPLIIHPVFSSLGVLNENESLGNMAVVLVLYLLMTSISITIDQRAFMVSSLMYVLYALSSLIKTYGGVGYSFALTGVFMGGALLLLFAYWHHVRGNLVGKLPNQVKRYIPKAKVT